VTGSRHDGLEPRSPVSDREVEQAVSCASEFALVSLGSTPPEFRPTKLGSKRRAPLFGQQAKLEARPDGRISFTAPVIQPLDSSPCGCSTRPPHVALTRRSARIVADAPRTHPPRDARLDRLAGDDAMTIRSVTRGATGGYRVARRPAVNVGSILG
jgi:hypothetical protein